MIKLQPITVAHKVFFLIKKNKGVKHDIAVISTNQRPVFIHCSERFQTILII